MANLLASLRSSADALAIYERALSVTQNNVANASTPGYVRQRIALRALPFDDRSGMVGGVGVAGVQSARDKFAEQAVRRQLESAGKSQQMASSLAPLDAGFDVTGQGGVAGALNRLYQSFSDWAVNPNSSTSREMVLSRARDVARSFQETASTLTKASDDADNEAKGLTDRINSLGEKLRRFNVERRGTGQEDPSQDANLHATLEELSELVEITPMFQADGSLTVLLGGQTPLVVGANLYPIAMEFSTPADRPAVYPESAPPARVVDASGRDITAQLGQGRLGGLLDVRNRILPSLRGDPWQPGDINRLAKAVADRVNQILTEGLTSDGLPGVPLFTYDETNDATVAQTLTVDPAFNANRLAAIEPGLPYVANGAALALAALASPANNVDKIDGLTYTAFYGSLAARVGSELSGARNDLSLRQELVGQARNLRAGSSGVSLDEEAVHVIEFQRAYQATARLIAVLDELTQTVIQLLN